MTDTIALANQKDLNQIDEMFERCKLHLSKKGIHQWDETYPNWDYFHYSIEERELYILKDEENVVGAIVLNEWQSPEWDQISWKSNNGRSIIIHAFCVDPHVQGKGLGGMLLSFAETYAKENNYTNIRLDAFSGNVDSCRFYEKRGYETRGAVYFSSKPEGHQKYICYEKRI